MKKFVLFFSMVVMSVTLAFAADNDGWKLAKEFDWSKANEQEAGVDAWWRVVLEGNVPSGENVLLYLNNLDEDNDATVEVTVYSAPTEVTIGGKTQVVFEKLEGPESKSIAKNKNYALEIGGSIIKNFNLKEVYVKITSNRKLAFSAEPVEPGEKDITCINATVLNLPGSFNYTNLNKAAWYKIDLKAVKETPKATVELTIENKDTKSATIEGGISFDCPSTGITTQTTTIAAGGQKVKTLDRSYIEMLASDEIYFRVVSDAKLSVSAKQAVSTEEVVYNDVNLIGIVELDTNKLFTLEANTEQWYVLDLKKVAVGKLLPEVVVENLGDATAEIEGISTYKTHYSTSMSRKVSLAKGAIKVQDIQRNVVNNAIKMSAQEQGLASTDTGVVYIRLKSTQKISFIARNKKISAGTACTSATDFDWKNGNAQAAGTKWYKIDITEAKAKTPKQDIKLTITNKSTKSVVVSGRVAFECPFTAAQDGGTRTIAAGATKSGVLKNSTFRHLAGNEIFVELTSDGNIEFRADFVDPEATSTQLLSCEEANAAKTYDVANIDPKNPAIESLTLGSLPQNAVWYKVKVADVKAMTQIPEIHVQNEGAATANVRVDVALECPVIEEELQGRSFSVKAGESYIQTPKSTLLKSVSDDVEWAYIRVTFNQPLSVWAELVYEDEGSSCSKPTNVKPNVTYTYTPSAIHWYSVDLTAAKAAQENIKLTLENPGKEASKVKAEILFECSEEAGTAYNYEIKAGDVKTKVLSYSMFQKAKDIVFIKLTSEASVKFKYELQVDTSDPIDICSKGPKEFDWKNGEDVAGSLTKDTTWFKLCLDTFEKDNYALVPKIVLKNKEAAQATVTAIAAFDCVVKSPMSKTNTVKANAEIEKMIERDMVKSYTTVGEVDSLYFGIVTDKNIHFDIVFINPDLGQDCAHAADFDWENGNDQEAGKTVWYDVDLSYIKNQPNTGAAIGITNTDGFSGAVQAELFFSCNDAEPFAKYSHDLKANDTKQKDLGRDMFTGMAVDHIFIRLTSVQAVHIFATTHSVPPIEPITACKDALPVELNVDIPQSAASQWYFVDLADIRKNTYGDLRLIVTNLENSEIKLKASVSYECEVKEQMVSRSRTLDANAVYQREAARSIVENMSADTAWILVEADKEFKFRVEVFDPRGTNCGNPIIFDWENGNRHPADSTFWYYVDLTPVINDEQKRDMRLIIENLTDPLETVNVEADFYAQCPSETTTDEEARMVPGTQKYSFNIAQKDKEITHSFIEKYNQSYLYIKFKSDKNTRIRAELIDPLPRHKENVVIKDTVCAGSLYTVKGHNGIADDQFLVYNDTTIHDAVRDSLEYEYDNTQLADSLFFYEIKVRKAPAAPQFEDLTNKIDDETLKAGTVLDLSAQKAEIEGLLNAAIDPELITLESVEMQYFNFEGAGFFALPTTPYSVDSTEIVIRYEAKLSPCDDVLADTILVKLAKCTYQNKTVAEEVCEGFQFTDKNNRTWTVDANYIPVSDTIDIVITEGVELGKEVTTYNYTPLLSPDKVAVTALPTASCGSFVDHAAADAQVLADLTQAGKAGVKEIKWQYKDENDAFVDLADGQLFPTSQKQIVLKYIATTNCDKLVEGDELTIDVADDCIVETIELTDTVCAGSTVSFYGESETITASVIGREYVVPFVHSSGRNADSIYTYNYYVYNKLAVPATIDPLPIAVCGEVVDVADAEAELRKQLDAAAKADPLAAPLKSIAWETEAEGNWADAATVNVKANWTNVKVRFIVTTECDVETVELTLDVQKRSSSSLKNTYKTYTAVSRYNGWILMVDQKSLEAETAFTITEDMIDWYQVVGNDDIAHPEEVGTANEDVLVKKGGWYYTEGKQLTGQYYAKIEIDAPTASDCEIELQTTIITVASAPASAPQLAPSMVRPQESILLSGLNAEKDYTVNVYDLMGNFVERFEVKGAENHTFEAQPNSGYYMVSVESNDEQVTLKYIVK